MRNFYQAVLIGGGASNLIGATYLADKLPQGSFCVLEKLPRVGKKLIATGNGQGNLTNANLSKENYYSCNPNFVEIPLATFNNKHLEKYLNTLGIYLNGETKKYPVSYEATSVLDLIREKLASKGVQIFTDFTVANITEENGLFTVTDGNNKITAKYVILAVGGSAQKQFGTDGTSYTLATNFGHKLTKLYPSLVQVKTETEYIKGLKGIKVDGIVKAFSKNGKLLKAERGDILFTDYGVSGSAVFQVSGHLISNENSYMEIEFLPDLTENAINGIINAKKNNAPYLTGENLLNGLINKQLARIIIKRSNGDIVNQIKRFKLKVTGSLGFNYAQVTKGGIDTKDINPETMESKLKKNLFLAGEMVDVDGDCGGYNLQWAFTSGMLAAKEVVKRIND